MSSKNRNILFASRLLFVCCKLQCLWLVSLRSLWWMPSRRVRGCKACLFKESLMDTKIVQRFVWDISKIFQRIWTSLLKFSKRSLVRETGALYEILRKMEKWQRYKKRAGVRVISGLESIWKKHPFSPGGGMKMKTSKASSETKKQSLWIKSWTKTVLIQKYREVKRLAVFSWRNKSEHFGDFGVDATLCAVPQ